MKTLLPGITSQVLDTERISINVLEREGDADDGVPVVFVHGNVSSAVFWQPLMLALPKEYRAIAVDLRGFGDSESAPVDATRGLRDFSDDLAAILEELALGAVHLVGWSLGGGVVMQFAIDHPVLSLTLQAPVSPYGFGGTALDGSLLTPDAAGTGGGGANPDFVARLDAHDTSADEQTSPRSVFRATYVAPGFTSEHEDLWIESMLTTHTGTDNYPGDGVASENWPGFAAGTRGVLNTLAPTNLRLTGILDLDPKPAILWIRGANDLIVSDTSFFDLNFLGQLGAIPGWPGAHVAPPQPMIAQTRAVLDAYEQGGGEVTELVLDECGHSPHLEFPELVLAALLDHIG